MTSKKENEGAREARSGPGRAFDKATDISFRTTYTEGSEPYDFTVDLTTRRDGKRLIGISAGHADIEWPGERLDWLIMALTRIKAASSESEDTQAKPTPTQADVDALVKAAGLAVLVLDRGDNGPRDDQLSTRNHLRTALTPFQKG